MGGGSIAGGLDARVGGFGAGRSVVGERDIEWRIG